MELTSFMTYDERLECYLALKKDPCIISYIHKLKEDDLSDDYYNYILKCLPYENWTYRPAKYPTEYVGIINHLNFSYHHSMYSQEERLFAWICGMSTDLGKKKEAAYIATLDTKTAKIYTRKNKVYADRASVYLIKSSL